MSSYIHLFRPLHSLPNPPVWVETQIYLFSVHRSCTELSLSHIMYILIRSRKTIRSQIQPRQESFFLCAAHDELKHAVSDWTHVCVCLCVCVRVSWFVVGLSDCGLLKPSWLYKYCVELYISVVVINVAGFFPSSSAALTHTQCCSQIAASPVTAHRSSVLLTSKILFKET